MPPRALRLSTVTLLAVLAIGAAWWWLAPAPIDTEDQPAAEGPTVERDGSPQRRVEHEGPAQVEVPVPAGEGLQHQRLDAGTRTEILDKLEARDALRVGPEEAARLRANRELILDDRSEYAEPR